MNSCLKPVGGRRGVVVAHCFSTLEENAVTTLSSEKKTCFVNFGKNKDSQSFFTEHFCTGIMAIELL